MREPRAILAAQIALEKTRQTGRFSTYYVIAHWRGRPPVARRVRAGEVPGVVVPYEKLGLQPARTMEEVCAYLEIDFNPDIVLRRESGSSGRATPPRGSTFRKSAQKPATRWKVNSRRTRSLGRMGTAAILVRIWLRPEADRRELRYFMQPIRGERPREYIKSRALHCAMT